MANLRGLEEKPYALICRDNILRGTAFVEEFSRLALRWRRSIRANGGFWEGSWWFPLDRYRPEEYLRTWYEHRLFHRIEERVGAVSWQGVVWEMELSLDGAKERRSLSTVYNRIKTMYVDSADDTVKETDWYENAASIAAYGYRELILLPDDPVTTAAAEAQAQQELALSAAPYPRTVAIDPRLPDGLLVTVVGDVFTANNRYVTAGDGSVDTVVNYIQEIVATDCQFLTPGRMQNNVLPTKKSVTTPMRAWDKILQLVELGDAIFAPRVFYVHEGGMAHYERANATPLYEWHGRNGGLKDLMGGNSPWLVRPAMVRNMTRKRATPTPDTFRLDGRDSWIAEVEMADGAEWPTLKPDEFDEDDLLRAQANHQRWLEREAEEGGEE